MTDNLVALSDLAAKITQPTDMAAAIGSPGKLLWLKADQLYVDPSYQRPIGNQGIKNIRKIAQGFHWAYFSALKVSHRGEGRYAVVDGQHHGIAALLRGDIEAIPCLCDDVDYATQAKAFATINGTLTKISPLSLHRAATAAGEASAIALNRVCAAADVTILAYPKICDQVGETMAVGTLEFCLKRFGEKLLTAALRTITQTGDGNPGLLREGIIVGTCDVLAAHSKWAAADVLSALSKVGVRDLYARALRAKADSMSGTMSIRLYYANALAEHLKRRLGDGGPAVSLPKQQTMNSARSGRVASKAADARAEQVKRQEAVNRAADRTPSRTQPASQVDERALIEAHLKSKGVRKLDPGASGHTANMAIWLRSVCGIEAQLVKTGSRYAWQIGRKKYDEKGFYAFVNAERRKQKLEPLTIDRVAA